jgi:hypothetical protein
MLVSGFVLNSRLGRVVIAIRDNEDRVRFSGYNPATGYTPHDITGAASNTYNSQMQDYVNQSIADDRNML